MTAIQINASEILVTAFSIRLQNSDNTPTFITHNIKNYFGNQINNDILFGKSMKKENGLLTYHSEHHDWIIKENGLIQLIDWVKRLKPELISVWFIGDRVSVNGKREYFDNTINNINGLQNYKHFQSPVPRGTVN